MPLGRRHTTTNDLFLSRYEVLKPLIEFATSNKPYSHENQRELMPVFSDLINTEQGRVIVDQWYRTFESVLKDIQRYAPCVGCWDEYSASMVYRTSCIAIDALAKKLCQALVDS